MAQFQKQLMNALDASVEQDSQAMFLVNLPAAFSFQAVLTGAPAGTLKLQMSNDVGTITSAADHTGLGITNWTDVTGSSFTVAAAGNWGWDYTVPGFRWVRLVWIPTSGTGAISVTFQAKG